jgi:DNA-directed RNA polymerase, mitochondrial
MSDRQDRLDAEMVNLGKQRYNHKKKRAKETSLESTTTVGQHLLTESLTLMAEALDDWKKTAAAAPGKRHKAYEHLNKLPSVVVAALVTKSVLDCISIERKIVSTAVTIGRLLEDELRFREVKTDHPALWQQIHRVLDRFKSQKTKSKFINKTLKFHDLVLPSWDRKLAASVGLTCIEVLRQSTGIIETITRRDAQGKTYTSIKPTDALLDWMSKAHEFNEALSPVWLPTVETPMDWDNPYIGGYSSASFRRRPLVKTEDKEYLEELANADMPLVYRALNTIQKTGYRVDGPLVDVLKHCWDKGLPIGGLPPMEDEPLPPKPENIKYDEEIRRAWRKSAARTHFENERLKSKRIQVMKVTHLADKFEHDEIWFPASLDFRGREYPIPYFLQPQGPEWAKSLLNFSKTEQITDEATKWLYIHAASRWGLDKESYADRLKWAEGNLQMIQRVGSDPTSDMVWADASEPWSFARACMEISRLHNEGSKFRTSLPVSMDATNQGLQIYGMVLRDTVAAEATNVTPSAVPQDVYRQVADAVRKKLYEDDNPYGNKWLEFGIDRKTTKRQTMTLCYGSTFFSCRTYTADWFYEMIKAGKASPFGDETYKPCNYLAEQIWAAIGEVVQSAQVGMDWLRQCASLFVKHDVTPRWVTPLGFPVKMYYENTSKYSIKTLVGGKLRQHRLRIPNGAVNKRKTVNAICPNWIHSLDGLGGLLGHTVNLAQHYGVDSIMPTHDCISVLATQADVMHQSVREATVEIFSKDQLQILASQLESQLPSGVSLPSLPNMGKLHIPDVLASKYYFN